jgi:hypothetical protein
MHKAIVEAQRKAQGMRGAQIRTKKGRLARGTPGNDNSKAKLELEIVNPVNFFSKQ